MNKLTLMVLAVISVGAASAAVGVAGVKVQPRSPWNGLVDIEYTVACDDPNADVYVNPVVYDGDRRITMFPSAFTGDGWTNTVKAGKHKLVWDAMKDFGAYSCANFQFKIYAGRRLAKYVKIDLKTDGGSVTNFPVTLSCVGPDVTKDDCRTKELWLRLVPPGEFWMGSPEDELGRQTNEDLHHVTFTQPFYMGVFEVTQEQYCRVMGLKTAPAYFTGSTNRAVRPMESISLLDMRGNLPCCPMGSMSKNFMAMLRLKAQRGGFDLPSESRWEYACRAGTTTALNNGKNLTNLDVASGGAELNELGSHYGNSYSAPFTTKSVLEGTHRVGSYLPNALGLYDMHGNVSEMCLDSWSGSYGKWGMRDLIDPTPSACSSSGSTVWVYCVQRGGAWCRSAAEARSAYRFVSDYGMGVLGRQLSYLTYTWNGISFHFPGGSYSTGYRVCADAGL